MNLREWIKKPVNTNLTTLLADSAALLAVAMKIYFDYNYYMDSADTGRWNNIRSFYRYRNIVCYFWYYFFCCCNYYFSGYSTSRLFVGKFKKTACVSHYNRNMFFYWIACFTDGGSNTGRYMVCNSGSYIRNSFSVSIYYRNKKYIFR